MSRARLVWTALCRISAPIEFSAAFYGALVFGRSVSEAFEQGKAGMGLQDVTTLASAQLCLKPGVNANVLTIQ